MTAAAIAAAFTRGNRIAVEGGFGEEDRRHAAHAAIHTVGAIAGTRAVIIIARDAAVGGGGDLAVQVQRAQIAHIAINLHAAAAKIIMLAEGPVARMHLDGLGGVVEAQPAQISNRLDQGDAAAGEVRAGPQGDAIVARAAAAALIMNRADRADAVVERPLGHVRQIGINHLAGAAIAGVDTDFPLPAADADRAGHVVEVHPVEVFRVRVDHHGPALIIRRIIKGDAGAPLTVAAIPAAIALGFGQIRRHDQSGHGGEQNRGETHFSLLTTRSEYASLYEASNLNRD